MIFTPDLRRKIPKKREYFNISLCNDFWRRGRRREKFKKEVRTRKVDEEEKILHTSKGNRLIIRCLISPNKNVIKEFELKKKIIDVREAKYGIACFCSSEGRKFTVSKNCSHTSHKTRQRQRRGNLKIIILSFDQRISATRELKLLISLANFE